MCVACNRAQTATASLADQSSVTTGCTPPCEPENSCYCTFNVAKGFKDCFRIPLFIVMGPDTADLPSRPRFSWDARCVPWTDGKGNQEEYARAVKMWRTFHNKLPDGHAAKILPSLQGIMLQSQLFGRARDLCMKISSDIIESDDGPDAIVNEIHKRDALAVVSEVYNDFLELLNTKRGTSESFLNFERRFEAKTSKFNSNATTTKLCLLYTSPSPRDGATSRMPSSA